VAHEGESLEAVVHRADQAMYSSKARYYEAQEVNRRQR